MQAVKTASLIEKNGYAFYAAFSKRAGVSAIKDIFAKLAMDEKNHKRIIEKNFYPEAGFGKYIIEEDLDVEDYIEKILTLICFL